MTRSASSHLRPSTAVIAGIVLVALGSDGLLGLGIALILGSDPVAGGSGLLSSGSVARWAARHRLFA